jgi:hypothetical protein
VGTLLSRPRRPDQAETQRGHDLSDYQPARQEHAHACPTGVLLCCRGNGCSVRTGRGQLDPVGRSEAEPAHGCGHGQRAAASRHGLDDLLLDIAQRTPDVTDAARDRIIGDHQSRPDGGNQRILGHHTARVACQDSERVAGQGPQFDVDPRTPQRAPLNVQLKGFESDRRSGEFFGPAHP